ncbi:GNAT family N-acetyltransferase [Streptomyces sp. 3MP-14]|uniref:GNAT family N-acetyltransferase n=1 Tax=Streptomyces mimosae TaxID=2586635 RepID=A0A5N5ZM99_9ACTN|nr:MULTISPECIES: GNAT family N-acetyltransferase [Streptomyces]KAB8157089.1 GNAT family N-acetyltransferase [Streptomyces mimosae]KAB8172712.1 GNAT family N-acetyltransferase [Streptomyces sp. 3MP-14]
MSETATAPPTTPAPRGPREGWPHFVLDPAPTVELSEAIAVLWADVTNAGGAVGFVPTVTPEEVRPALRQHLVGMAEGTTRLLIGANDRGQPIATAFLRRNTHRLMRHWLWLSTVMVHPDWQGRGAGRELMAAAASAARAIDPEVTGLRLTCRGGLGLERFYASCGYQEVGRVPNAIRVGENEFRDDITLWLPLG